jgi:hypothetical protein
MPIQANAAFSFCSCSWGEVAGDELEIRRRLEGLHDPEEQEETRGALGHFGAYLLDEVGNVSTQRPHRRTKGHTEERYEEDTSIPAGRRISAKFPAFFGTFWGATARRPTGASNRVVLQGNDQTNTLNVFSLMVSHRF